MQLLPLKEAIYANSSFLEDEEFCTQMNSNIDIWKNIYSSIKDKRKMWELIKYEIRRFCMQYGKRKKSAQNIYTGNLLKKLNEIEVELGENPNEEVKDQYENIKMKLQDIEDKVSRGSILRSKAKYIEEGEKPTKYFFDLEKKNAIKKHIRKLILPGGTTTTNPEEILEYMQTFYSNLYKSKENDQIQDTNYFLDTEMKSLPNSVGAQLGEKLTLEECKKTLCMFTHNKSPGNDGLTIEFYKAFWKKIGNDLIDCFNYSYEHGELTITQRQAIISLIEKYGKDRFYIKNWRPISLLNVDYKIVTKTLAMRLKKVLPEIIHIDQSGYVEGRQIFESIRLIQDLMEITKNDNIPGIMLLVDFEKAFDSIEWSFMYDALNKLNFGNEFIRWVKLLYTNISSCLVNNGTSTKYFTLTRGLRQGDPLSGYLFIVVLELLAEKIHQEKSIKGI